MNIAVSTEIKLEDGIPLPNFSLRGRPNIYPLEPMAVGQSFLLPRGLANRTGYRLAHYANKRYAPKKFKVAKVNDGYRCWRVA